MSHIGEALFRGGLLRGFRQPADSYRARKSATVNTESVVNRRIQERYNDGIVGRQRRGVTVLAAGVTVCAAGDAALATGVRVRPVPAAPDG